MNPAFLRGLRIYALIIAALMLLPLLTIVLASLGNADIVRIPPESLSFRWWAEAIQNPAFRQAFVFSLQTALLVAVVGTLIGSACAWAISRFEFPGRRLIEGIVLAPLMIPNVIIAVSLLQLTTSLGLRTSPQGLVLGQIVVVLPFAVRLMLVGMTSIDGRLEDASLSLGASRLRTLVQVVLPMLAPALIASLAFTFLIAFDETTVAIFMSSANATTLPVELFNYVQDRSDPMATAVSAILILIACAVVLVIDRFFGVLRLFVGAEAERSTETGRPKTAGTAS
jgi:putative spermidine/putrescine transport system permease protein